MEIASNGTRLCVQCFDPCDSGDVHRDCLLLARPTNALSAGTLLRNGAYCLGKVLGYGGAGITYLGWDTEHSRKVAVKEFYPIDFVWRDPARHTITLISPSHDAPYQRCRDRFAEEATKLESLRLPGGGRHPYIVDYFEYVAGEYGTDYIIMEYVGDWNLEDYLNLKWEQNQPLSFEAVMKIMHAVMDGLAFVHEHDLLHLDVSPRNICLTSTGTIKLIDFGSAKAYIANVPTHTQMKKVCPGFSAPELYGKTGYGRSSDIYSVAAIIYFGLTAGAPPDGNDRMFAEVDPLPPIPASLGLSPEKDAALMRALAIKQGARFQDVREFQRALAVKQKQVTPDPVPSKVGPQRSPDSIFSQKPAQPSAADSPRCVSSTPFTTTPVDMSIFNNLRKPAFRGGQPVTAPAPTQLDLTESIFAAERPLPASGNPSFHQQPLPPDFVSSPAARATGAASQLQVLGVAPTPPPPAQMEQAPGMTSMHVSPLPVPPVPVSPPLPPMSSGGGAVVLLVVIGTAALFGLALYGILKYSGVVH